MMFSWESWPCQGFAIGSSEPAGKDALNCCDRMQIDLMLAAKGCASFSPLKLKNASDNHLRSVVVSIYVPPLGLEHNCFVSMGACVHVRLCIHTHCFPHNGEAVLMGAIKGGWRWSSERGFACQAVRMG